MFRLPAAAAFIASLSLALAAPTALAQTSGSSSSANTPTNAPTRSSEGSHGNKTRGAKESPEEIKAAEEAQAAKVKAEEEAKATEEAEAREAEEEAKAEEAQSQEEDAVEETKAEEEAAATPETETGESEELPTEAAVETPREEEQCGSETGGGASPTQGSPPSQEPPPGAPLESSAAEEDLINTGPVLSNGGAFFPESPTEEAEANEENGANEAEAEAACPEPGNPKKDHKAKKTGTGSISLAARGVVLVAKRVHVHLRCHKATCSGKIQLKVGRVIVARGAFSIQESAHRIVSLRLTRVGAKRMHAYKKRTGARIAIAAKGKKSSKTKVLIVHKGKKTRRQVEGLLARRIGGRNL